MAATYRVGIVGLGRVASSIQDEVAGYAGRMLLPYSHTHAYAVVPQTRVCAVADIDSQKTAAYLERWQPVFGDIAAYASYEEMLQNENLDIVSVCTHAPLHAPVTQAAVQAGVKAVFCEKAIATSLAEADAMIAACEEHDVKARHQPHAALGPLLRNGARAHSRGPDRQCAHRLSSFRR